MKSLEGPQLTLVSQSKKNLVGSHYPELTVEKPKNPNWLSESIFLAIKNWHTFQLRSSFY